VRALDFSTAGYQWIVAHLDACKDEDTRRLFLENVPAHREILSEFAKGW
jgi:hypothetical protein